MYKKNIFVKNWIDLRPYMSFMFLLAMIVFFSWLSPEKNLSIARGAIFDFNDNWEVSSETQQYEAVNLPYKLKNLNNEEPFVAKKILDETFPNRMAIRIRASMQDITVKAKGEVIYQSNRTHSSKWVFPEVSMWHLVELPNEMVGEMLEIEFRTRVDTFSGVINPIYYGKKEALIHEIVEQNFTGFVVALTMLITGLLSVIASIILSRLGDRRLFYLGAFSITASIWMLSEMRVLQLFTGNRFILGGISYLMLPFFSLTFLKYIEIVILEKYKKYTQIICFILYLLFYASIILQLTGIALFIDTIAITVVLIGIVLFSILCIMSYESFILKNKQMKLYLMNISVLIVTGFLEISVFFSKDFELLALYSKLGFGLFMFFQFVESIKYFNNLLVLKNESKLLEQMAYKDILTGGYNRAAYERDLDDLLSREYAHKFRLVLIDFNNLKYINDTFGHSEGDLVIKSTYDAIVTVFSDIGTCYRLGGDEFACILSDIDDVKYKSALSELDHLIEEMGRTHHYAFSIAIGDGVYTYTPEENSVAFGQFFHKVDLLMYEQKKTIKSLKKTLLKN